MCKNPFLFTHVFWNDGKTLCYSSSRTVEKDPFALYMLYVVRQSVCKNYPFVIDCAHTSVISFTIRIGYKTKNGSSKHVPITPGAKLYSPQLWILKGCSRSQAILLCVGRSTRYTHTHVGKISLMTTSPMLTLGDIVSK